jgi:PTH2 family peptidyl-tRNA hydrolase
MQDPAGPSTANIATACAIMGVVTGYLIGQAKSLGLFGGSALSEASFGGKNKEELDTEDESDDDNDSAPAEFPNSPEECKLVLVVRTDLGMTKGVLRSLPLLLE